METKGGKKYVQDLELLATGTIEYIILKSEMPNQTMFLFKSELWVMRFGYTVFTLMEKCHLGYPPESGQFL